MDSDKIQVDTTDNPRIFKLSLPRETREILSILAAASNMTLWEYIQDVLNEKISKVRE